MLITKLNTFLFHGPTYFFKELITECPDFHKPGHTRAMKTVGSKTDNQFSMNKDTDNSLYKKSRSKSSSLTKS